MQVCRGFCNWKNATTQIQKHQESKCHREAVEVVITLPKTTVDIGEQLSLQHAREKDCNCKYFLHILSCIKYLVRQGLAIRGDGDERDSNFFQLLKARGNNDIDFMQWLEKKKIKYTSHDIQNEIVKLMALYVLRNMSQILQDSPFLTLIMDETTDVSNKEQVVIVMRRVSESFEVHEEFLGLYEVSSIDASTLTTVAKDVFARMNLPISKLRGQCYDGASTMKGVRSGVASQILAEEPRAVYTHCYGHSLNLAVNDVFKIIKVIKDALGVTHEVTKLIKYSPKREAIFREIQNSGGSDYDGAHMSLEKHSGIRPLCPTRWTVRADSLASIIENYSSLQSTWDEVVDITRDSEIKARIIGVAAQMKTFEFAFAVHLAEMLLRHTDNLSKTLQ